MKPLFNGHLKGHRFSRGGRRSASLRLPLLRIGAALLGAAAGAVAVVGLVTAGPGLPGSGLNDDRRAASAPLSTGVQAGAAKVGPTASPTAAALASIAPAAGASGQQLAALEDVGDAQRTLNSRPAPVTATTATAGPKMTVPDRREESLAVAKGDTLMKVLLKAGSDRRQAHAAIAALSTVYDPRRLMPGQIVTVAFRDGKDDGKGEGEAASDRLTDVVLQVSPARDAVARLDDQGRFTGQEIERSLETRLQRASATIDDSLYLAAEREKLPASIIVELIRLYSFDIDFQRDIQPNDSFDVLYESQFIADGSLARNGDIVYARLSVNGSELPLYRYRTSDGLVDYFDDKGHSVRKALMKTPIDGARLSSRFGKRRHPILGYNKMHRGVDFAARAGTPIMAAGRGTVEVAGWNGGYGRYIRIRHNGDYKTAYAHLSRFARGVTAGKRVRQGQIIGYVGTSGRSTGPHLHYEVHAKGRQINPLGLKLPSGRKLSGKELAHFQDERSRLDAAFAALATERQLAEKD